MTKYTLYTEDKGNLARIVRKYFESFTLIPGVGFWKDAHEPSLSIVIILPEPNPEQIGRLARNIRITNKQETVLVEVQQIESELV